MLLPLFALLAFGSAPWVSAADGYKTVGANDPAVKRVSAFVETMLNAMSNNYYISRISDVIEAKQRPLKNSVSYEVKFQLTDTTCTKTAAGLSAESCPLSKTGKVEICTAVVHESRGGETTLSTFSCSPGDRKVRKRGVACAGCISEPRPVDKPTQQLFFESLAKSNLNLDPQKVSFIDMTTQVVQGAKYVIRLRGVQNGLNVTCTVTLWSRLWLTPPENRIIDHTCK